MTSLKVKNPNVLDILQANHEYSKKNKTFFTWLPINITLLAVVICDLWKNQRINSFIVATEHILAFILSLNVLYLCGQRFLIHYFPKKYQVTFQQFNLLQQINNRIGNAKNNVSVKVEDDDQLNTSRQQKFKFESFRVSTSLLTNTSPSMKSDNYNDSIKEKFPMKRYHASPSSLFANAPVISDLHDSSLINSSFENYSGLSGNEMNSSLFGSSISRNVSSLMKTTLSSDEFADEVDAVKKTLPHTDYKQMFNLNDGNDFWKKNDSSFFRNRYSPRYSEIVLNDVYQLSSTAALEYVKPVNEVSSLGANLVICKKFGVNQSYLSEWIANLRLWITQTILTRIIKEIDEVNQALTLQGITNVSIGSTGLERLKKTAAMSQVYRNIPSLSSLITFLDISKNQEYVVQRLTALSTGSMSNYCWNAGGTYEGKPWNASLPTDAELVMHLIAAYFDSQLFPLPQAAPDGRQFSSAHYVKTPTVPNKNKKSLIIYFQTTYPPHFQLIIGEETYDISRGRNNLFHVILFFLQHIKTKESGMFEHVNLGSSGINMLWIINDPTYNLYKKY